MAMTPSGRAQSIYNAVQDTSPHWGEFSPTEQSNFLAYLTRIFGSDGAGNGDLVYIQGNADVLPTAHSGESLSSATGQTVTIPITAQPGDPSHGATDEDLEIVGKGSIV